MHLFCAVDMAFRATPENAVSSGPDPQATGLEISCGSGFFSKYAA
jgi:hypothetical protein